MENRAMRSGSGDPALAPEAERLYAEEHGGQRHERRDFGILAESEGH